jgi:hypothetical protein
LNIARWLGLGIGLSSLLATSAAAAQGRGTFTPESQEDRLGIELDWLNTANFLPPGGTINIVTWDLTAQFGITPTLFLDVDIPWAYLSVPALHDRGLFGNPLVGVHYSDSLSPTLSFFVGGALGVPVNANPDGLDRDAASRSGSIRAFSGLARFAPEAFPVIFRGGLEIGAAPIFARFDLVPTVLIALNGRARTIFVVDQGNEVGFRGRRGFLVGGRLQANFTFTSANDQAQLALEPFVGYEADGPGLYARIGLLFALDEVAGFGFDRGKDRIGRFSIGGKF